MFETSKQKDNTLQNQTSQNHNFNLKPNKKKKLIIFLASFLIVAFIIGLLVYFYQKPSITQLNKSTIALIHDNITVYHHRYTKKNIIGDNVDFNYSLWSLNNEKIRCMMGNISYVNFKRCSNMNNTEFLIDLNKVYEVQIQLATKRLLQRNFWKQFANQQIQNFKKLLRNNYSKISSVKLVKYQYDPKLRTYSQTTQINQIKQYKSQKQINTVDSSNRKLFYFNMDTHVSTTITKITKYIQSQINTMGSNNNVITNNKIYLKAQEQTELKSDSDQNQGNVNINNDCFGQQNNTTTLYCKKEGKDSLLIQ